MSAPQTVQVRDRVPSAGVTGPQHATRSRKLVDSAAAWTMVSPALALFIAFIVLPMIAAIGLSVFSWHILDTPRFVGLENFSRMGTDPIVWQSLARTFEYVALGLLPPILIGFMVAVLINAPLPGVSMLRVLYFVPVILSVAVSAVVWSYLIDPRYGPVAAFLRGFGIQLPDLLQSTVWALPTLVVIGVWGGLPVVILLYLAALQRIPLEIYEAAALDGARPWRILWSITWPNVMSTTVILLILGVIGSVSGALDLALIMTNGGPLGSTRALGLYIYETAFQQQDAGYAAALSLLQLAVITAVIGTARLIRGRREP